MPEHEYIKVSGRICDLFAHRFVIETADQKRILADIGPKGLHTFELKVGLDIVAEGEKKPSELKVTRIARKGETLVDIEHKKPPHEHHKHSHGQHAEPRDATKAVAKAGFEPIGEPRRKPKHFEVLARKNGRFVECHVEFNGHIRKEKLVDADDHKWAAELAKAA